MMTIGSKSERRGNPALAGADHRTPPARRIMATAFRGLAWLTLAGLIVQVYFAGTGAFGARTYALHGSWGTALGVPILALPILALLGRAGRRLTVAAALLLVLYIAQLVLAGMRGDAPYVAALHPVNGFALLGVTVYLARPRGGTTEE